MANRVSHQGHRWPCPRPPGCPRSRRCRGEYAQIFSMRHDTWRSPSARPIRSRSDLNRESSRTGSNSTAAVIRIRTRRVPRRRAPGFGKRCRDRPGPDERGRSTSGRRSCARRVRSVRGGAPSPGRCAPNGRARSRERPRCWPSGRPVPSPGHARQCSIMLAPFGPRITECVVREAEGRLSSSTFWNCAIARSES